VLATAHLLSSLDGRWTGANTRLEFGRAALLLLRIILAHGLLL